jgi:hypothetical protein
VTLAVGASGAGAVEWRCYRSVAAFTEQRAFTQLTGFECGASAYAFGFPVYPGHCGDMSHTPGATFVDWVAGVSESCDDHDEGFMGPYEREWHGCSIDSPFFRFSPLQRSESLRWIGGVNPNWSAWPWELYDGYYSDSQLAALNGATVYMRNASGQLADLDTCRHIQRFNWVEWGSFPSASSSRQATPTILTRASRSVAAAAPTTDARRKATCAGPNTAPISS